MSDVDFAWTDERCIFFQIFTADSVSLVSITHLFLSALMSFSFLYKLLFYAWISLYKFEQKLVISMAMK